MPQCPQILHTPPRSHSNRSTGQGHVSALWPPESCPHVFIVFILLIVFTHTCSLLTCPNWEVLVLVPSIGTPLLGNYRSFPITPLLMWSCECDTGHLPLFLALAMDEERTQVLTKEGNTGRSRTSWKQGCRWQEVAYRHVVVALPESRWTVLTKICAVGKASKPKEESSYEGESGERGCPRAPRKMCISKEGACVDKQCVRGLVASNGAKLPSDL